MTSQFAFDIISVKLIDKSVVIFVKWLPYESGVIKMNDLKLTSEQEKMVNIFVRALPTLRKEVGVSQTLLGQKIGKSRQTISLIERGASPLTWDTFLSIILFFKVNYNKDKKVINDLEKFLIIDENDERLK